MCGYLEDADCSYIILPQYLHCYMYISVYLVVVAAVTKLEINYTCYSIPIGGVCGPIQCIHERV